MADKRIFDVRVDGPGISPRSLSIKDVGELLLALYDGLEASRPHGVDPDDLVISLTGIEDGSAKYALTANDTEVAQRAAEHLSDVANRSIVSRRHKKALERVRRIARRRKVSIELVPNIHTDRKVMAVIHPEKEWIEEAEFIEGETTLYGVITRIGGEDPTVRLRLHDNTALLCRVNAKLARELALHLYQEVALRGNAKWDLDGSTILDFSPSELTEFRSVDIDEAFKELNDAAGPDAWKDLTLAALREEDD